MRSPGLIAQNCCRSARISRKATGLVAGLYQRWRTVAHCTQPEPRHLLQLGSEDTQKSFGFLQSTRAFKNFTLIFGCALRAQKAEGRLGRFSLWEE
jgi:hypothetical protein